MEPDAHIHIHTSACADILQMAPVTRQLRDWITLPLANVDGHHCHIFVGPACLDRVCLCSRSPSVFVVAMVSFCHVCICFVLVFGDVVVVVAVLVFVATAI